MGDNGRKRIVESCRWLEVRCPIEKFIKHLQIEEKTKVNKKIWTNKLRIENNYNNLEKIKTVKGLDNNFVKLNQFCLFSDPSAP